MYVLFQLEIISFVWKVSNSLIYLNYFWIYVCLLIANTGTNYARHIQSIHPEFNKEHLTKEQTKSKPLEFYKFKSPGNTTPGI